MNEYTVRYTEFSLTGSACLAEEDHYAEFLTFLFSPYFIHSWIWNSLQSNIGLSHNTSLTLQQGNVSEISRVKPKSSFSEWPP